VPDVLHVRHFHFEHKFNTVMPTITNQNADGRLEPGVVLTVSGASSENEAILAIENYLREHKQEQLEVAVRSRGEDGVFEIALE
jgi:hypothetical protein